MKFFYFIFISFFILQTSCSNKSITSTKHYSAEEIKTETQRFNKYLDDQFDKSISYYPTYLTHMGKKERYNELDDISYDFAKKVQEDNAKFLKGFTQFNYNKLDEQGKISYNIAKKNYQNWIDNFKYYYHSYFVNQMFGHHTSLPAFMINQHRIDTESDAKAYISRLKAFTKSFNQLITKLEEQKKQGIRMPNFIFDKVTEQSQNVISGFPFKKKSKNGQESPLYADFKTKIDKMKIKGAESQLKKKELLKQAKVALISSVEPSYNKFISFMKQLKKTSTNNYGVWSLPNGKNYYNVALEMATTTNLTAPQIHELGIKESQRIQNEMRKIMKQVNFKGSLKDFFHHLKNNEKFYYPDTEVGKKQYLDDTKKIISSIRGQLDDLFDIKPKAALKVKPVEAFREKATGLAFYQPPAANGSRPGIYFINQSDMKKVPKYEMESLAYHEAIPGHHMEKSISMELKNLPQFRRFWSTSAYSEGWGLYAESLPKDWPVLTRTPSSQTTSFFSDPYSDFGRLSLELLRANRLVVDTGIHYYKWSREKAIDYLNNNSSQSEGSNAKSIERYFVMPGQATSYKVGQLKILELRKKARKTLGDQFNVRMFHNAVLQNGALPLNELENQVNLYIKKNL